MRVCSNCNLSKTHENRCLWYRHKDGFLCQKCRFKLVDGPKRVLFKNERITLKQNPRKGICSWCGHVGRTHLHHKEYHKDDPLKDTIELCTPCHFKEHRRLGCYDNHPYTRNEHGRFTGRK